MKSTPIVLCSALVLALGLPLTESAHGSLGNAAGEEKAKTARDKRSASNKSDVVRARVAKRKTAKKAPPKTTASEPQPTVASAPWANPYLVAPPLTMSTQLRQVPPVKSTLPDTRVAYVPPSQMMSMPAPSAPTRPVSPPAYTSPPVWQARSEPVAIPAYTSQGNPFLSHPQQVNNPAKEWGQVFDGVKSAAPGLPSMPSLPALPFVMPEGQSLLPVIKTVYPTGEKPLVIVTFKCPTELVGITPLPTKALHDLVTFGMDSINSSNLLSFNMQQVCQ